MRNKNVNLDLNTIGSIGEEDLASGYKAALGGDTGRDEMPNLPAEVKVQTNYQQMMDPVQQQMLPEERDSYASSMLGLPRSAPPILQLTLLANRAKSDDLVQSEKGRQVGANLVRQQLTNSTDRNWIREPFLS